MLAAARRCFLEHGAACPTSVIADTLGVSSAALFRRVGNKKELMLRALTPAMPPTFVQTLEAGPDDRPVLEQLTELARQADEFFTSVSPFINVLRSAGMGPEDLFASMDEPPPVRALRAMKSFLSELAEGGRIEVPDLDAAAMAFMGGMHSCHFMQHACGDGHAHGGDRYPEAFASLFFKSVRPDEVSA